MRRPPRPPYVWHVEDLPWVYGAALRAASNEMSAAQATRAAIVSSATLDVSGDGEERRRALMARAVASALRSSPSEPLAALPLGEREAIGLARIVGMNVDEIARFTGSDASEVKARMRAGLGRLVSGLQPASSAG
jgi:DNA-directed RNA polymerase specialized sigma24 family protein